MMYVDCVKIGSGNGLSAVQHQTINWAKWWLVVSLTKLNCNLNQKYKHVC